MTGSGKPALPMPSRSTDDGAKINTNEYTAYGAISAEFSWPSHCEKRLSLVSRRQSELYSA